MRQHLQGWLVPPPHEPLKLDLGQRFVKIGAGSGYGATVAREIVGSEVLYVSIEIDLLT